MHKCGDGMDILKSIMNDQSAKILVLENNLAKTVELLDTSIEAQNRTIHRVIDHLTELTKSVKVLSATVEHIAKR